MTHPPAMGPAYKFVPPPAPGPIEVKFNIFRLRCFKLTVLQLVIQEMLQFEGPSPLTPIEVKYNIFQTEMFEIGYLATCGLKKCPLTPFN